MKFLQDSKLTYCTVARAPIDKSLLTTRGVFHTQLHFKTFLTVTWIFAERGAFLYFCYVSSVSLAAYFEYGLGLISRARSRPGFHYYIAMKICCGEDQCPKKILFFKGDLELSYDFTVNYAKEKRFSAAKIFSAADKEVEAVTNKQPSPLLPPPRSSTSGSDQKSVPARPTDLILSNSRSQLQKGANG